MSNQTIDLIAPYLDAINIDIKSFDDNFYRKNCGVKLKPVLDNCQRFLKAGVWLEITTLIIPTLSDRKEMLEQLADFIKKELGASVPWHLSAFSGVISWRLQHFPSTAPETIKEICKIGKKAGLEFVYAGNVWDNDFESTYCPKCHALLVARHGYSIKIKDLNEGVCAQCRQKIPGRWK